VCRVCLQHFSAGEARFCPFDGEPLEAAEWDPSTDPLLGSVVDNRYEVEGVLGEGGMGTVYRVRHKALERPLALKALRRDLSEDQDLPVRFIQEAKAAAAVEHPNIVQITDFGTLGTGQPYFVMELLEGESLSAILRQGPLSPTRTVDVAIQVAEALAAAHAAGVIHRDLKPDNVHVRRIGKHDMIKVLDFGLAKVAGTSRLTRAGMVFGTPHYMSPEQAAGELSDHRVDIYALGVATYEMLTGRLPFEADSFTGVLAKHMYMDPPRPSEVVGVPLGAVEEVVLRCMAKRPDERYASMSELLADLDRVRQTFSVPPESSSGRLDESGTGDVVMSLPDRPSGFGRRRALTAVVAGTLCLALGIGIWALAHRRAEPPDGEAARAAPPASLTPAALTTTPGPTSEPAARAPDPPASAAPSVSEAPRPAAPPPARRPAGKKTAGAAAPPRPPSIPTSKPKVKTAVGGSEIIDPWK
jgi:eukaryotic-like serine/threonine-protein kinase